MYPTANSYGMVWLKPGLLSSAPQVLGDPVIDDQRPSHGPKFLTLVCLVTSAKADDPLEHFQAPQLVHDYGGWLLQQLWESL